MKARANNVPPAAVRLIAVALAIGLLHATSPAYLKMDPPPDVNKAAPITFADNSCWQATAANMLAAAGYGTGTTVQTRAQGIYNQMTAHFGTASTGQPDTAGKWWLNQSGHNTQPNNPYTQFTLEGVSGA